jgi:hypothetical protein
MRELMKNGSLYTKSLAFGSILLLCTSLQANAQPVITGVAGDPSHGSTLTITGTGFGTKNPVKPLIWADFEGDTLEGNLSFSRVTALTDTQYLLLTTANQSLHSNYSSRVMVNNGGIKQSGHLGVAVDTPSTTYYVFVRRNYADSSWWTNVKNYKYFWPNQVVGGGGRQIIIVDWGSRNRVGVQGSGTSGDLLRDTNYGCYEGTENCDISEPATNSWLREEYQIKDGDPGVANGTWHQWIDGVTKMDRRGDYLTRTDDSLFGVIYAHNFPASTDLPPSGAYVYMDDFYVDTTWSRVMIGDRNTFDSSTHREIQLPKTWSDNSITIQVNAGSFTSLGNSYLYVVDANGRVNQQGYSLCSSCPQPPQHLTVE